MCEREVVEIKYGIYVTLFWKHHCVISVATRNHSFCNDWWQQSGQQLARLEYARYDMLYMKVNTIRWWSSCLGWVNDLSNCNCDVILLPTIYNQIQLHPLFHQKNNMNHYWINSPKVRIYTCMYRRMKMMMTMSGIKEVPFSLSLTSSWATREYGVSPRFPSDLTRALQWLLSGQFHTHTHTHIYAQRKGGRDR